MQSSAAIVVPAAAVAARESHELCVRTVSEAEQADWDCGVATSPQNSPFLKSPFLSAWADACGRSVSQVACIENGRLVGGVVGHEVRAGGRARFESLPMSPCTGVWMDDGPARLAHRIDRRRRRILTALADYLRAEYVSATVDCHIANTDLRPLTWSGWRCEVRYTLMTNLAHLDESAFDPDVRQGAPGSRLGIQFDDRVRPDELESLWCATHVRQSLPLPLAKGRLSEMLGRIAQATHCEINGVRTSDGSLIAANAVLIDGDTAHYWLAGFDAEHDGSPFLTIETLRRAVRSAQMFDWVGANTPSVAEFKQSFGSRLTAYQRASFSSPSRSAGPGGWWSRFAGGR